MSRRVYHIIVAAGSGSRYGSDLPKQFLPLEGERPVLMTTLARFMEREDDEVIVVLSAGMIDWWQQACDKHGFRSPAIVTGGATRHQSVANAIRSISTLRQGDVITVHDGARPLVTSAIINNVLAPIVDGSAVAVIPVVDITDSIREDVDPATGLTRAVDRRRFHAVQTPQAFEACALCKAFEREESEQMTDEASVMELAGYTVKCVAGDPHNIKITRPGDLEVARLYIARK